jgi:hypothetical protein
MSDGATVTVPLNPGFNVFTDPNNLSFYEIIGLSVVIGIWSVMLVKFGFWVYKVSKASIDYKNAKKELMQLEHKLKEAELRALEIKAGL